MATVHIDGKSYRVSDARNLLEVALSEGLNLPYFCWHPALGSVGACRQCAVTQYKDEDDDKGKIVMACMTSAKDGTRISIEDEQAVNFRKHVIEWLMVNHPHDCPVCDEGGECHLQDMTVMARHPYRRFRFRKRTYRNQDLGPLVNHEMNRCIQCYRCVRFYHDYAGGKDLEAFAAHDHVYFGRHEDGTLESEFAGNLVEVCPTGVFTDKTLKAHYTRKWDLQTAPSVCAHCSLGCNTIPGERYGTVRRVRARYHGEVNGYFLCDRGRYGYEFIDGERRIRAPLFPAGPDEAAAPADRDTALARARDLIGAGGSRVIGIGSPRASLESNFALRTLVGADHFHRGTDARATDLVTEAVEALGNGPVRAASLAEVGRADAVLVLGEDASNTAPMLALMLRQAARREPVDGVVEAPKGIERWNDAAVREVVQNDTGPLYVVTPAPTRIDDAARATHRAAPGDIARLGFAVAHAIHSDAPQPDGLDSAAAGLANEIAAALSGAKRPAVVSGTGCGSTEVIRAAANVARALGRTRNGPGDLFLAVPEWNTVGADLLAGNNLEAAFDAVESGRADTLVVLENNLYRRAPRARVDAVLEKARVIVIDHTAHDTGARADVILPAATFADGDGTAVNNEGRAQRFYQVTSPQEHVQESWRWIRDIAPDRAAMDWDALDDVVAAMAAAVPPLSVVARAAPNADYRQHGARIPRQPPRYSGRTAMHAHENVSEPKPPDDPDSPLSFSMEGAEGQPPGALTAHLWSPGWNSVQSVNKFQIEVEGPLRGGDPGVRLFDETSDAGYHDASIPESGAGLTAVPLWHCFGSEELSAIAGGTARLSADPYVALAPADAGRLGLTDGQEVTLRCGDSNRSLPLRVIDQLAGGCAGVPVGLRGFEEAWAEFCLREVTVEP